VVFGDPLQHVTAPGLQAHSCTIVAVVVWGSLCSAAYLGEGLQSLPPRTASHRVLLFNSLTM
jgi:hypothetical protein